MRIPSQKYEDTVIVGALKIAAVVIGIIWVIALIDYILAHLVF
jgi:hypothetical protein